MSAASDDALVGRGEGGLAGLCLAAEDLRALARQGFVAAEWRGGRGPYFKVRWRVGGRVRVRYLGRDPGRASPSSRASRRAARSGHCMASKAARARAARPGSRPR